MWGINLIKSIFLLNSCFIGLMSLLINFGEHHLPPHFRRIFRYGKFSYSGPFNKQLVLEVPKQWFKHFYVFASLYSLYGLYLILGMYTFGIKPSGNFIYYLDLFCGLERKTSVNPVQATLAIILLSLQSLRRFYETWFISVFSDGKMNLTHYLVGFIHYWGTITVILSESPGFQTVQSAEHQLKYSQIEFLDVLSIVFFIFAWTRQLECAVILAKLRKNREGKVCTTAHKLPEGGWFTYLSSPHLFCEVLLYFSLLVILRASSTFPYVFIWVLSNQVETAFLNHWWYKENFKNYPSNRKAFIPYLL